jgi:hypothetical protein
MSDIPNKFALKLMFAVGMIFIATSVFADGEFWGFDISENTNSGVLAVQRGNYNFGAGYTDYGDGVSASLIATRRLPFDFGIDGLKLSTGPAIGFGGGDLSEPTVSLSLGASRYTPNDWGATFLQVSASTNRRNYFSQAQLTLSEPGVTFSVSRGGSLDYSAASVAISKKIGDGPVSVKVGYRLLTNDFFVGFSVSTF